MPSKTIRTTPPPLLSVDRTPKAMPLRDLFTKHVVTMLFIAPQKRRKQKICLLFRLLLIFARQGCLWFYCHSERPTQLHVPLHRVISAHRTPTIVPFRTPFAKHLVRTRMKGRNISNGYNGFPRGILPVSACTCTARFYPHSERLKRVVVPTNRPFSQRIVRQRWRLSALPSSSAW